MKLYMVGLVVVLAGTTVAAGYALCDFNLDGSVNISDVAIFSSNWPFDVNDDGDVDIVDLTDALVGFGEFDGSMPVGGGDIRVVVDPGVDVGPGLRMWGVHLVNDTYDTMARAFQGSFTGSMNQVYVVDIPTPTMDYAQYLPDPDLDTHFMLDNQGNLPMPMWTGEDGPGTGTYLETAVGFVYSANLDMELARIVIPVGQTVLLNGAACNEAGLGTIYTDLLLGRDPGDTDGDLKVDILDLTALASNWSALPANQGVPKGWAEGDFDNNQLVDIVDLTALAANWHPIVPWVFSAPPVPEPATLALLAIGGVALLIRRRA